MYWLLSKQAMGAFQCSLMREITFPLDDHYVWESFTIQCRERWVISWHTWNCYVKNTQKIMAGLSQEVLQIWRQGGASMAGTYGKGMTNASQYKSRCDITFQIGFEDTSLAQHCREVVTCKANYIGDCYHFLWEHSSHTFVEILSTCIINFCSI